MPLLTIGVRNKVAESPTAHIVCGNSDYIIEFNFDEEWDSHETKTARFIYDGKQADVIFTGNTCPVPIITNARVCMVGVFAGDLQTTTPALIECEPSILCGSGVPADPTPDVYAQLLEMYDQLRKQGIDDAAIAEAIEKWLEENPIEGAEVPDALPNPHKLTFTGAVEAEYDGSKEVTVEIPEGGGGGIEVSGAEVGQTIVVKAVDENGKPTEWECAELPNGMKKLYGVVLTEPVTSIKITEIDGKPMSLKEWQIMVHIPGSFADYATPVYIYPINPALDSTGLYFLAVAGDPSAANFASARTDGENFIWYSYNKYMSAVASPDKNFRKYIPSGNVSTVMEIATYNNDKPLPIGTLVEVYGR